MKLNPVGSVRDKLMTKTLINERQTEMVKIMLILLSGKGKAEQLTDLFKELHGRLFNREGDYLREKARDTLELHNTMEEAKKFIKE